MSRAFVKEGDGALDPLPDLPVSPHPNWVTPRGLGALRARLLQTQTRLAELRARPDRMDKLPEAAAERDIRYLEARLRSAIPVDPAQTPTDRVGFGHRVTLGTAGGQRRVLDIVGEDEADPAQGRISLYAPLARALLGAEVGDSVDFPLPGGADWVVLAISCP